MRLFVSHQSSASIFSAACALVILLLARDCKKWCFCVWQLSIKTQEKALPSWEIVESHSETDTIHEFFNSVLVHIVGSTRIWEVHDLFFRSYIPGISQIFGKNTTEVHRPFLNIKMKQKKTLLFSASVQHVKNVDMMMLCNEYDMWRLLYCRTKLKKTACSTWVITGQLFLYMWLLIAKYWTSGIIWGSLHP